MSGQSWSERIIRYVIFNWVPSWVHANGYAQSVEYRPQIAWLPLVENRGTWPVKPQDEPQQLLTVEYADDAKARSA
ncbi:hypothetical protein BX616_006418 [Lobosporangium transversale]|nr:hypothetical protein BX616_006418 [Lobosporangium transversale]